MGEKQKTGSVAFKAGIWYVVSNIVVKAVSVITTPVFTRLMTTEEYGTVQTFVSWNTLLLPVFSLNLAYSVGRAKIDYPGKLDSYLGSMQTLTACFCACLAAVFMAFLKPVSGLLELTQMEAVLLILYLFFEPSITLYQNGYRYRYQYVQNIAIAWYTAAGTTLLSLFLILGPVSAGNHADSRILGIVLPTAALSSFFWMRSIRGGKLCISREYWRYGLTISLPLILHTISMHVLSQSDRIFITKIWGKTDTAYYSLAYTYGVLLHVLTTAISDGWLPWFHDSYAAGKFADIKKNVKPLVVLGCYIGLASIALAPEGILIMGGTRYAHSVPCVPPVVLGVVCQYVYTHYVNVELHLKKTGYVSAGTIVAALFNIVTNAVFIPVFGMTAAAYTTLASYFLLMLIHFIINKKVFHVRLYDDWFMFGALAVAAAVTGLLMFSYGRPVLRYSLVAAGFVSFCVYFRPFILAKLKRRK